MCGIAGIFTFDSAPSETDARAVTWMLNAQAHRGPDDWGLLIPQSLASSPDSSEVSSAFNRDHVRTYRSQVCAPGVVFGARRLSIIDRSARGRMPMGDRRGRVWITYNGEAYNYRQLRAELNGPGSRFSSDTDTEAILRGYELWGPGVLPRLCGMFAFAIFEAWPIPRVILARDRFGIKPLYYYRDPERLIFASEVRALLRSGLVPDEPNPEAVIRFLQLGSVPVPHTTVRGVQALPAGHCLIVEHRGSSSRRYWNLSDHRRPSTTAPRRLSHHEAIAATRALLEESLERHLISDVPLGVFLSGGIDSSALVALASRLGDRPLTTLSIVFDEAAWSEARYARLVAARYRTDHREMLLKSQELFENLPRFFSDMDEPSVDGVNTYFIARAARAAGLTVVLSGTGGDEVFLGYDHLRKIRAAEGLRQVLHSSPFWLRKGVVRGATRVADWRGQPGVEKLEYLERPTAENAYLLFRGLFSPREIVELLDIEEGEFLALGPLLPAVAGTRSQSLLDSFTVLEFQHYLQNQLLKDTDVMSMAHAVETRVPYLDHPLVEHVLRLPRRWKLAAGRPKPLLVDALGADLPREVWDRPKMGFTFPFAPWLKERAEELRAVSLERKFLQRRAIEDVWRRFKAGRLHWSRAWALVVLGRFDAGRKWAMAVDR
jgi:asparagine synthase (glutamine-hydrolysing)